MTRLWSMAAVTCAAAFVFGMVLALLGSLKLRLAKQLRIGEARVGGLVAALNLALIPMMLISGALIDTFGVRPVLIVGSLVLAVAVFSLALSDRYRAALGAAVLAGAGAACVCAGSVVLMPDAFGFGRDEVAASVNLGHVFFALGALVTPTLSDLLLRTTDYRKAVAALALLCLVPAVVAAVSFTAPAHFDLKEKADVWAVLGDPHIWLVGVAFLLYAPLEFALSTWGTTYLTHDQGFSDRTAARLLSLFWLAFLAARLLMTWALHRGWLSEAWAPWVIFFLALWAAVLLGNLAGAARPQRAAWGLVATGFALGPIFPTLVAIALEHFPERRGTAYGSMYAIGSLGSLFLAPLLGALARRRGANGEVQPTALRALRWLAPLALLLVVAALAIGLK